MGETVFRRNPTRSYVNVLKARSGQLKQTQQELNGKSAMVRNPAWIRISGVCRACNATGGDISTLPISQDTWRETYTPNIKPKPILEEVTITYGGEWGLAQKLSARIKCFSRQSFEAIQKNFLLPGNLISAKFGYSTSDGKWVPNSGGSLENFVVATFSFSAGEDGTWIGQFTAVHASQAVFSVDMQHTLATNGLKYKIAGEHDSEQEAEVISIATLIESDAQRNGSQKLDTIKEPKKGYVITQFADYTPTPRGGSAGMVIYTADHRLKKSAGSSGASTSAWRFPRFFGGGGNENEEPLHDIYVTLGYVVDRIVNDKVKKSAEKGMQGNVDYPLFQKIKILFDAEYSVSRLWKLHESGDPLNVLLLGRHAKFTGGGDTMDFNVLYGEGDQSKVKAMSGDGVVALDKILISRDVVFRAMGESTNKEANESESVDPKDTKDSVTSLNDFFREIFSSIKDATGGALALKLVPSPKDDEEHVLYVVDQNYAGDASLQCPVFDPVDGDGSTRSCNISSNGGSNEYRVSMFLANSKKGDVAAHLRGCQAQVDSSRNEPYVEAAYKRYQIINSPGTMMLDKFDGKQIDDFKATMVNLYRYAPREQNNLENINWPGMTIDLTINGTYGVVPGCAVATTQMPKSWYETQKIYFMVTEVTHTFANSDWTTNIRGIMAFYKNLDPIAL